MSITGTGNFAAVEAPTLSDTSGIKVYSPTAVFTADQSPYSGTKQFQQAIIVTDPAAGEIPPVIFSYFDPDAKLYRTLFSDPVALTVNSMIVEDKPSTAPTPAETAASSSSSRPAGPSPVSLVPVKLDPGTLVEHIRPPFLKLWFIAAVSLCVVLIAGFFGFRVYNGIQAGNAEASHKKILAAKQKETLSQLDGLNPDIPDYPAQARKLIQELLIVHRRSDSVSLTTADVIEAYGSDSVVAEIFRLGDGTLYGKLESTPADRRDLHKRIHTFVMELS